MTSPQHRVLVIGVGSIGERHLRCFQKTGRAQVSLCELNEKLRTDVADRYDVQNVFTDLDEAIDAGGFDAAVICTPAQFHIPMAAKLAEQGVNLLVEKPLSTTLDGIEGLIELVERKKVTCSIGYTWRSHPATGPMKEAIDSGKFGKPVQLVYIGGQHFPTYRPAYRDIYYARHESGGGCIQDAVTHMANLAEWFVGPIDRIIADAEHKLLDGVEVEDMSHYMTRHGDVLGSFSQNQYQAPSETIMNVLCEKGTVQFLAHKCMWRYMVEPDSQWVEHDCGPMERDDMYVTQANSFMDTVEGKREPVCTLREGYQTLKVNLAALTSVQSNTWQTIN